MITVAFQGDPGAFSEEAAHALCGDAFIAVPCRTYDNAFNALMTGKAMRAVVPVENSIVGRVEVVLELLKHYQHKVINVGEVTIPIHHCVLARSGTQLEQITRVYSHPAALAQCSEFVRQRALKTAAWYDTAGAARHVASKRDPEVAAIAARRAADRYGLVVIAENVEDTKDNCTRFVLLQKK